jgi:hypothetical protein
MKHAPRENRYGAEMIAIAAFNNLDNAIKNKIKNCKKAYGGWNHHNANFVERLKTALKEKLLKAMPDTFMEAYRQALALEKITAEPKKQFVSVQAIDARHH